MTVTARAAIAVAPTATARPGGGYGRAGGYQARGGDGNGRTAGYGAAARGDGYGRAGRGDGYDRVGIRERAGGSGRGAGGTGDDGERYGLGNRDGRGTGSGRGNGYDRGTDSGRGDGSGRGAGHGPGAGYGGDDYGWVDEEDRPHGSRLRPGNRAGRGRRSARYAAEEYPGSGGKGGRNGGGRGRDGKPAKRKGSWWRHWTWKKALAIVLGGVGAVIVAAATFLGVSYAGTPIPTDVSALALQQSSTVYFSNGKSVVGTFGTTNRQVLTSNQIPAQLKNAVVAAEDRNFYNEGGISPTGIMRALYDNITGSGSSLQGGSTITQQFVRNYYANIGTQQTISRKLKEIFVAIKLARQKSKDWILTQYLNTVYFGNGAYGVEAAAETFFGKHAGQLNVSQDAMIAAMLNAPGAFDPTPGSPGYQPLVARWQYVLQGMVTMGKLTQREASAQKFPKVVSTQPNSSGWTGYNGYIMQAVYNELYYTDHVSKELIDNGGLHIVTTFSKPMMDALYATVNDSKKLMRASGAPLPSYAHVGAVLEQPGTGAIVAMYSGPSYSEPTRYCLKIHCQVDMALGAREQVGSSFKPYVLATARAQGMNVKTSILDGTSPLCVPGDQYSQQYAVPASGIGQGACPTTPYGWHAFSNDAGDTGVGGPQSVVYSTAHSLNTAYTDLTHRVGTQNVINMAKSFGVDTGSFQNGGSGLQDMVGQVGIALGTAALSVGEQASTFATLAADGQYVTPHVIQQITQGTNLITPKLTRRQALTPAEAADVNYPLSFVTQAGGTGTNAAMSDGRPIIGKTGTTSSGQSAFFLGAIPQYSLAVGMFTDQQNSSTTGESLNGVGGLPGYGGNWPAMIWHSFAEKEFARLPIQNFASPSFGGTTWNLVGPGASLVQPKPHPAPTHAQPSPAASCNHDRPRTCHSRPPGPPAQPNPIPSPTCTTALRCNPGPPKPGTSSGGTGGKSPAKANAVPAAVPARVPKGGSG